MVVFEGIDCISDKGTEVYSQYTDSLEETWNQNSYSVNSIWFAVALLVILIIRKGYYLVLDSKLRYPNTRKLNMSFFNKLIAISRYFAYKRLPILFSRISGLPPSIGALFIFTSSAIFCICYAFVPNMWFRGCSGFGPSPLSQRTSMIAMTMTPFLIIMSGKTNFISAFTGITYEKLNFFHQALGWGSLFFAIAHTVPFLVQDSKEGGFNKIKDHWYENSVYRNGLPPLIFLILICLAGLRIFRKYFYEAFWHLHWMMGLAYFGTLGWHVYGTIGMNYIWTSIGFCCVQMLYRIIMKSPLRRNSHTFKHQEATITLLPNMMFEVVVPIKSKKELLWKPGQHILIRFMYGIHTLDNHPFSILTIPKPDSKDDLLKLVVRSQKGLTRCIYDGIASQESNELSQKFKVYIDGAYGGLNRDCLAFDKLILVATGTGISVTFPFMLYVAQNLDSTSNNVKCVDFTWIIGNIDYLEAIKDQLQELFEEINNKSPALLDIFKINIFVTQSPDGLPSIPVEKRSDLPVLEKWNSFTFDHYSNSNSSSSSSSTSSKKELAFTSKTSVSEATYFEFLNIYHGQKPVLNTYIADTPLLKRNAIIVSGSSQLQCDVGNGSSILQRQVLNGNVDEVYLHTENLGW